MTEARQLGTCRDYDGLLAIVRQHVEELNISRETIDYASGAQSGYSSKIFAPTPTKRMGPITLPLILETLGLRLAVEIDPEATARLTSKLPKREVKVPIQAAKTGRGKSRLVSKRFLRKIARLGGVARMASMSAKQRSKHGRKAVLKRWSRPRVTEITRSQKRSR
jgi:hypothetical protein